MLLGGFYNKVGREDIFKPTIENESLHKISNDTGVRIVNVSALFRGADCDTDKYLDLVVAELGRD
jgi:hypothetical protein